MYPDTCASWTWILFTHHKFVNCHLTENELTEILIIKQKKSHILLLFSNFILFIISQPNLPTLTDDQQMIQKRTNAANPHRDFLLFLLDK